MYYFVPVEKQGQTLALLVGMIDCESLPDVFKTTAYNGEAFSCLIDYKDGSFIMDDWHERLGNLYEMKQRQQLKDYEDVDLIEDVSNAKTGVTAYKSAEHGKEFNEKIREADRRMYEQKNAYHQQQQAAQQELLQ